MEALSCKWTHVSFVPQPSLVSCPYLHGPGWLPICYGHSSQQEGEKGRQAHLSQRLHIVNFAHVLLAKTWSNASSSSKVGWERSFLFWVLCVRLNTVAIKLNEREN